MSDFPKFLVPPSQGLTERLAEVGRFLPDDYYDAMFENSMVQMPAQWTARLLENPPPVRNTTVMIVGAHSVPFVTARHVWLAKASGATRIVVKSPTRDETLAIQEMTKAWEFEPECKVEIFEFPHTETPIQWTQAFRDADHIVVYGGESACLYYRDNADLHQQVHLYGPKFSFGVTDRNSVTSAIVDDFTHYYGQGCLSPRFYFVIGDEEEFKDFLGELEFAYSDSSEGFKDQVDEYVSKLPLSEKVKVSSDDSWRLSRDATFAQPLALSEAMTRTDFRYGLGAFVRVPDMGTVLEFCREFGKQVSTVALEEVGKYSTEIANTGVTRLVSPGGMQRPGFWWWHDGKDELAELEVKVNYK